MALKENPFKKLEIKTNIATSKRKTFLLDERQVKSVTSPSLMRYHGVTIEMLPPLEKKILDYIKGCTPSDMPVMNCDLLRACETSAGSLRNAIQRLKSKSMINVLKSKNGPAGWRIYEVKA